MKADHTTHDLSLDEVVLPVQHMFPNCGRYTKCCKDIPIKKMKKMAKQKHYGERNYEYIKYFWFKNYPAPEGFEKW